MSSMLGSQSVVLATAMAVSTTVIFIAFSKQRNLNFPPTQRPLRSCLSSSDGKSKKVKKTKKRVRFAENVKEPSGNGEEYRRYHDHRISPEPDRRDHDRRISPEIDRIDCRSKVAGAGMPANRAVLYSGILRDRMHRIECSY